MKKNKHRRQKRFYYERDYGKEFSKTTVKQTSDEAELITIEFSDGSELTCTKYHKFYIQTNYSRGKMVRLEAKDLKKNMKLIKHELPIIRSGNDDFNNC